MAPKEWTSMRPKVSHVTDQHLRQRLTAVRSGAGWQNVPRPTQDDLAYARVLLSDPCVYCGGPAGVIDHITHDAHGWENLTACCRACNVAKGQHTLLRAVLSRQLRLDRDAITQQLRSLGDPHGENRLPMNHPNRKWPTEAA